MAADPVVQLLQCYNKGCGQLYDPNKNTEESCVFHPGTPVFHDAFKSWSCCDKRVTDFTEFLNIKGCTKSFHSNVKPPEPEKPKVKLSTKDEVITYSAPLPIKHREVKRPNEGDPMVKLPITVAESLKSALAKQLEEMIITGDKESADNDVIKKGTGCFNSGCSSVYEDEKSNDEECRYHPGVPIFHEGMKYWLCCQRKTSDFSTFLKQEGCTIGKHAWTKKEDINKKEVACRYDWHQTGAFVIISVYAKCCDPELSYIMVNQIKIHIYLVFDKGQSVLDLEMVLKGVIDVQKSNVTLLGSKVEVKLKKSDPMNWSKLCNED